MVDLLVELGIDEVRASNLIGEMDCPKCNTRLYPLLVVEMPTNEDIHICYLCELCNGHVFYDMTKKVWERNPPTGWAQNIRGFHLNALSEWSIHEGR